MILDPESTIRKGDDDGEIELPEIWTWCQNRLWNQNESDGARGKQYFLLLSICELPSIPSCRFRTRLHGLAQFTDLIRR